MQTEPPGWSRPYGLAVLLSLAVGLWILRPCLDAELIADDYVSAAMLEGEFAAPRSMFDLFNFADGTASDVRQIQRLGSLPWWTPDNFRVAMLRPLASALIALDRVMFGEELWLYHLHSMLWWVVLVLAVAHLYAGRLSAWPAALALLLFATDQSHHDPVMWLSNRGGLMSVAFGTIGLNCHLAWREHGRRWALYPEVLCFSLALLCGEWVFPLFAYVAMFELFRREDGWGRRALSLAPAAIPALAFVIVRGRLGYGARESAVYVDPVADPLRFLAQMSHRVPTFVGDMLFDIPSAWWIGGSPWRARVLSWDIIKPSLWKQMPDWHFFQVTLGVFAILLAALAVRWVGRGLQSEPRRTLWWLSLGALLSLVPVAGSFPSRRLVLVAMLGAAPLVALVAQKLWQNLKVPSGRPQRLIVAAALLALAHTQLVSALREDVWGHVAHLRGVSMWAGRAEVDDRLLPGQRVFMVASLDFPTTYFLPYMMHALGHPMPRSYYPMSGSHHAHMLRRPAANVLELEVLGGTYMSNLGEGMFRDLDDRLRLGETFELEGLRVEVVRLLRGQPRTLRFTFERDVEDPGYLFLTASRHGIVKQVLPTVGQGHIVKRSGVPNWVQLQHRLYKRSLGGVPTFVEFEPTPLFLLFEPE